MRLHAVPRLRFRLSKGWIRKKGNGVRSARLWARLAGVERAVVERVEFDEDADALVVAVRPRKSAKRRCGVCGRRCGGYDQGEGRRRWRALDLGTIRAFLEADAPRVCCPEHGVVVAQVPWARHGAGHTRVFDDTAAWLAVHASKQAVRELLRVAWRTVGRIVARVGADAEQAVDRLDGLARIGIDEISHRKGQRYLTVIVDHDSGRLVWAAPGHDATTLGRFFDLLGEERCAAIRLVSADAAEWIARVNDRLYRAWLLKEELRLVFKLKGVRATVLLEAWLGWARRCRIPAFVRLARSISQHRAGIQAALTEGLSNGLVESVNTKIRLLTRVAFGFRSPEALIALAMLSLGGLCPPLPGRA